MYIIKENQKIQSANVIDNNTKMFLNKDVILVPRVCTDRAEVLSGNHKTKSAALFRLVKLKRHPRKEIGAKE